MQIIIFTNSAVFPPSFPKVFPAACNPIWLWLFLLPSQRLSLPQELVVVPRGGGSLSFCLHGWPACPAVQMEKQMVRAKSKSVPCHVFVHDSDLVPRYASRASQVIPNPEKYFAKQLSSNSNSTVPLRSRYSSCLYPHMATIKVYAPASSMSAYQNFSWTKFLFSQSLIRLKFQIFAR